MFDAPLIVMSGAFGIGRLLAEDVKLSLTTYVLVSLVVLTVPTLGHLVRMRPTVLVNTTRFLP